MTEAKKAGQFRAFWKDFNESVNLMASGEVVIQSMWSPAVTAVRSRASPCNYQPLKEGYRAWAAGFGLPKTLTGKKLDAAYEFINWFLSGWAGAYLNRQGYYSAVLETAKAQMEPYEWAYWMEGKPAEKDIKAPDGRLLEKAGAVRDGGSYETRMGGVACWNAVMDENDYMVTQVERVHRGVSEARGRSERARSGPRPPPLTSAAGAWIRRLTSRAAAPYWQAAPLALVFALFFVLPLVVTVHRQLLELHRAIRSTPALSLDNYVDVFDGLPGRAAGPLHHVQDLPVDAEVLPDRGVAAHARPRLHVAYFLAFHIRSLDRADGALPRLHHPVLDLERHPHDLLDSAARPQRPRQQRSLVSRRHRRAARRGCSTPISPWSWLSCTSTRCS